MVFYKKLLLGTILSIAVGTANAALSVPVSNLESFLGITTSGLIDAAKPSGANSPTEGSAVKDSFAFQAGDIITFDYNFLTNELGRSSSHEDDYAFVTLTGIGIEFVAQAGGT